MLLPNTFLDDTASIVGYALWLLLGFFVTNGSARRWQSSLRYIYPLAIAALVVLWSLRAYLGPAVEFHFLGTTVFTLMFGLHLAFLGVSLAYLVLAAINEGLWQSLPATALLFGLLPVAVSYGSYRLIRRYLPRHPFCYIFGCGFATAILAAAVSLMLLLGLVLANTPSPELIHYHYWPLLALLVLPEGLLNGLLTTALLGTRPDWLRTLDADYLDPNH